MDLLFSNTLHLSCKIIVSEVFLMTIKYWSISKLEWYFRYANIDYDTTLFSSKVSYYLQEKNPESHIIVFRLSRFAPNLSLTPPSSLAPLACSLCSSCTYDLDGGLHMLFPLSLGECLLPTSRDDSDSSVKTQLKHHTILERSRHLPPFSLIPGLCWALGLYPHTFFWTYFIVEVGLLSWFSHYSWTSSRLAYMYHLLLYPFLAWEMTESSGQRGEFCFCISSR